MTFRLRYSKHASVFVAAMLVFSIFALTSFSIILSHEASAITFPGVNGKIAFSSFRDGNYEIYTMNADGSDQTRLTKEDFYPFWSPDGTKILFSSFRDGNYEIYVMNADGSDQLNLTNNE